MKYPIRAPTGTASANAVSTSLAVTARSLRTLARCNRSPSVDNVSEADGSSRGLTMPVRDSISHSAKIARTIAKRAILIPKPAIVEISGPGRDRLELRRDHVLDRYDVLQPAEFRQIERQLHRGRYVGGGHVAFGL